MGNLFISVPLLLISFSSVLSRQPFLSFFSWFFAGVRSLCPADLAHPLALFQHPHITLTSHVTVHLKWKCECTVPLSRLQEWTKHTWYQCSVKGTKCRARSPLTPKHHPQDVEGAFFYDDFSQAGGSKGRPELRKHVFWSSSSTIQVSPSLDSFLSLSTPRTTFRDGFTSTIRSIKRRPSGSSLNTTVSVPAAKSPVSPGFNRTYSFSFDLPRSNRTGEEIPPTFVSAGHSELRTPGAHAEDSNVARSFGVEYKLSVAWEPTESFEYPSFVTAPIYYHPDTGFQSLDGSSQESKSWLEMPLRVDRPMPLRCAITLPTAVTFSRSSSIPYYVVFTTTPRSPALAREIASDATISASLIRQITVTEQSFLPPTPPQTPGGSDESDGIRGVQLLKRVVKPLSPRVSDESLEVDQKPLPRLPMHAVFKDSRLLHTSICIGFPKRPRQHTGSDHHPSLEAQSSLPDGLHKAKFNLNKDMLPSIDWQGVSVKYYIDISVLVGSDTLRARIPIRVT